MKRATCVHFIDSFNSVLLAWQERKIVGRKGYGGKLNEGEDPRECTLREVKEETGGILFDPKDLMPVALIDFYNGDEIEVPEGNPSFRVLFYNCYTFTGTAISTYEMRDPWFYPIDNLPPDIVEGDELFLTPILEGNMMIASMRRTKDFKSVTAWKWRPCTIEELVI